MGNMRGFRTLIALACLTAAVACAQTFEVASVKPSAPGGTGLNINLDEGRFTARNVPLQFLITFAYDVRSHEVTGGPAWINSDRWDITAKPESRTDFSPEGQVKARTMVRALLADRFQLVIHRETKELPIYALVIGKNGSKLTPSTPESRGPSLNGGRGGLRASKVELALLCQHLSNNLGRTVRDETGLTGSFDFTLEFQQELPQGAPKENGDIDLPSVFTALQEQLGLKLEPKRGPVEILVVDRAEKAKEN